MQYFTNLYNDRSIFTYFMWLSTLLPRLTHEIASNEHMPVLLKHVKFYSPVSQTEQMDAYNQADNLKRHLFPSKPQTENWHCRGNITLTDGRGKLNLRQYHPIVCAQNCGTMKCRFLTQTFIKNMKKNGLNWKPNFALTVLCYFLYLLFIYKWILPVTYSNIPLQQNYSLSIKSILDAHYYTWPWKRIVIMTSRPMMNHQCLFSQPKNTRKIRLCLPVSIFPILDKGIIK